MIFFFKKLGCHIKLEASTKGIKSLQFVHSRSFPKKLPKKEPLNCFIADWFIHYFEGEPNPFPWEALDLSEATPFEKKVWRQLHRIPFGETVSYQQIAERIGTPKGSRAVGQANGRNPIPLLIPCHRAIAADGSLGGYSCGLELKRKLLEHEGVSKIFE